MKKHTTSSNRIFCLHPYTQNNSTSIEIYGPKPLTTLGNLNGKKWNLKHPIAMFIFAKDNTKNGFLNGFQIRPVRSLVGGFIPSEKYESQLGWWNSQLNGKIKSCSSHHQPDQKQFDRQTTDQWPPQPSALWIGNPHCFWRRGKSDVAWDRRDRHVSGDSEIGWCL